MKIAVQLYTVRDQLEKDFKGTLRKIKELGYEAVEFAGFYGYQAREVKELLDELNLDVIGSHTGFESLEKELEAIIRFNKAIGNKRLVIPYTELSTYEHLESIVNRIKAIEEKVSEAGLTLHYHNHEHEFALHQGRHMLDLLFEEIPNLGAEIDTYWVRFAGYDPVQYISQYSDRASLIHLKDMVTLADGNKTFAPLGRGQMDLKSIVDQARASGVEAIIVENDQPRNGSIEDITISINHLKSIV